MGMRRQNAILAILFTIFAGCHAGEYCSYSNSGGGGVNYLYCDVTCCGYYYNRYCCTFTSTALYIGAIAGAVVCIALIIGILLCCIYKGKKTSVRRHRNTDNNTANDQFQCSRIYRLDAPKPPPYSIHYLHPPEYHEDPPPRYLTPIPGSEYHNIPGTMADS